MGQTGEFAAGSCIVRQTPSTVLDRKVIIRALKITLIAGTLYNLINQGDKFACLAFGEIDYLKFPLTHLLPFLVSTYTAVSMKLAAQADIQPAKSKEA